LLSSPMRIALAFLSPVMDSISIHKRIAKLSMRGKENVAV
jgi:hypothetical protein